MKNYEGDDWQIHFDNYLKHKPKIALDFLYKSKDNWLDNLFTWSESNKNIRRILAGKLNRRFLLSKAKFIEAIKELLESFESETTNSWIDEITGRLNNFIKTKKEDSIINIFVKYFHFTFLSLCFFVFTYLNIFSLSIFAFMYQHVNVD